MSGYGDLSAVYDTLMTEVDYDRLADCLLSLAQRYGRSPQTVLDLACGSGSLCLALAERGIEVVGVDGSTEMLARAAEKTAACSPPVLLLAQDMRELDLYGTVDAAFCTMDSLNHLCRTADLNEVFRRLRLFVEPGGLFIFDVNTPYKHREVLGDRCFVLEQPGVLCAWRNSYRPRTGEVWMQLDFFLEEPDGNYVRCGEDVRERAYSQATLCRLLNQNGWDTLAVLAADTTESPAAECERWVFVAQNRRTVEEAQTGK